MDEEGRIVFQGTLMLGHTPRQALFNAFGMCEQGTEIDTLPHPLLLPNLNFRSERMAELFLETPHKEIEEAFWSVVENEGH